MKYIVTLTILLLWGAVCCCPRSDAQTVKRDSITQTERIVDKYMGKVGDAIAAVAEKLKVPAERVYSILVKQQVVRAWTWLIADIAVALMNVMLWWFLWWDKSNRDEWWGIPVFTTLIWVGLFAGSLSIVVTGFVNPEYGAIQDILSFFK